MSYSEFKSLIENIGLNPELCSISILSGVQYFYYDGKFIADNFEDFNVIAQDLINYLTENFKKEKGE